MVVLSDLWPLYTHTFQSKEFDLNCLNFYIKSVVSIFVQYI